MSKEDVKAIEQWALKVRDTYNDIQARKKDVEDHTRDSIDRLDRTWVKFKELEVQEIIADEALFRELKDRFGSRLGLRRVLHRRHGRGGDPRAAAVA